MEAIELEKFRRSQPCFRCKRKKYNPMIPEQDQFVLEDEVNELKTCSGCKLVTFCSKSCQAEYWEYHKKGCLIIKKLRSDVEMFEQNNKFVRPRPVESSEIEIHKHCSVICSSYEFEPNTEGIPMFMKHYKDRIPIFDYRVVKFQLPGNFVKQILRDKNAQPCK